MERLTSHRTGKLNNEHAQDLYTTYYHYLGEYNRACEVLELAKYLNEWVKGKEFPQEILDRMVDQRTELTEPMLLTETTVEGYTKFGELYAVCYHLKGDAELERTDEDKRNIDELRRKALLYYLRFYRRTEKLRKKIERLEHYSARDRSVNPKSKR